jgi:hypothetical protein
MIFKYSVRTAKKTQHLTIKKNSFLTLFKEIIHVYSENRTIPLSAHYGQNAGILNAKAGGIYNYHSA